MCIRDSAGIEAGSFGHRSILVGGASARAGAGALVGLRYERADNDYEYVDDAGTTATSADDRVVRRPNADARSWDVWAIGRTRLGRDARLTTLLNGFSREQGVTGLGVIPARHARARVQRTLVGVRSVSYTHLRAHETVLDLVCRLLLDKKHLHALRDKLNTTDTLYTNLFPNLLASQSA